MVQRVREASVAVSGRPVSAIGAGLLVLLGVEQGDDEAAAGRLARRLPELRLFGDEAGRMNLSLRDIGGEVLLVSQFTLAASLERGRRPSFDRAAPPEQARALYDAVVAGLEAADVPVRTGLFGAMMQVALVNDGPVTFVLESGGG